MIELNCTYEESKKILELGYNFRRVCKDFYKQGECSLYKFTEAGGRMVLEVQIKLNRAVGEDGKLIPIIPKGILEKCLPKIPFLKTNNQFDFHYTWKKPDFDSDAVELYTRITHIEIPEKTEKEFQSAYEAFIWCHENYPEELKKKFEEVMK